ncbi:type II secretion system protein GspA [Escherichia coli]|nr:type II secretion system protein GspA [Escherichia coli]
MSTRREVILSWLCEKRQTWRLCYLLGEAGSGKTWLAQQLQKDKHRRVITLSLVVSWQGKAAWIVTDDNAAEQGCRDSAWTRDEMAGQLLHALHRTDSRCPLIIIENAHLNHRRILDDLQRAISLIPDGQFLLIGRSDRKVERDFKKQGIELVSIGRLTEHELKASILEGQNIDQPDLLLTARVLKRIALLCRGDRRKMGLAGETIRLLQQAEQTSVFTAKQWRMIYRILGDNRPRKMQLAVVMSGTIIALTCGWLLLSSFTATLPVPAWLIPVTPVVKQDMTKDIAHVVMRDSEALSVLYGVWGYEVPADSAWCDQAVRAGLACKSGNASLQTLVDQNLPWIASLKVGDKKLPVVVVRVGEASVDVLVGQQTWTLTHKWFESVWTGDYLLLWKMSPEGESTITRDSSEEEILWLETMLNRALHISTEPSAEWRPLLVEKIKQFQKSHHLKTDGVVGFSTLVHLWQVAGESAYLYRDEANISPETTVKGK